MDLIRLDDSDFYSSDLIENYDSLIWTERYSTPSEFQLTSYATQATKRALPLGAKVSLRDSRQVMMVEKNLITVDDSGHKVSKVSGRCVEAFAEQRVIQGLSGQTWAMPKQYSSVGAVEVILYNIFCNDTGNDFIRGFGTQPEESVLPGVKISEHTNPGQELKLWYTEAGNAYAKILEILDHDDLGLRSLRPNTPSATVITAISWEDATITRTAKTDVTSLLLDVYEGVNRTQGQSDRNAVIFYYDQGNIANPGYLFTNVNKKNVGYWTTPIADGFVGKRDSDDPSTHTGWDRREMLLDFGDKLGTNDGGTTVSKITKSASQKSQLKVKKRDKTLYFDGELAPVVPQKYNTDYNLGDQVTLIAEYDVNVNTRIIEYIRTQDQSGETGYPTLAISS